MKVSFTRQDLEEFQKFVTDVSGNISIEDPKPEVIGQEVAKAFNKIGEKIIKEFQKIN